MKKHIFKNRSIRVQMTWILILIMSAVILGSVLINVFGLEPYYVMKEEEYITQAYKEMASSLKKDDSNPLAEIVEVSRDYDYQMLLSEDSSKKAYTTVNEEGKMFRELKTALEKMENVGQLSANDYVIVSNKSPIMDGTNLNLIGRIDGKYTIVIATPMENIHTSAMLSGRFTLYVGLILMICGGVVMYIYSRRFAKPIEDMAGLANQMSDLDFNVKVDVEGEDELGRLGSSLNTMSEKLEMAISDLKTANNQLQKDIEQKVQIDTMRKEFLSHVSHELKTPIALIQGYSEGLKDNVSDDPENREFYCEVISDEAKKMNRMVQKLLTLNQIEFGNQIVEMQRFDITEMISNMVNSNRILLDKNHVTVEFSEPETYVWADEFMIEEVISNYLSNARNHVISEGIIRVSYETVEDNLRVKVFNTGKHIPEEDIDKLWVKFYKVDKARTREYGGSGIGLSIVEATMKAHGKDYGVANVEGGVEFYFELELDKK